MAVSLSATTALSPPRHAAVGLAPLHRWLHRSIRLVKKAMGRPPAVVAAQNLIMQKLGLSNPDMEEVQGFEKYVKILADGLTEEKAHIIDELFMCHVLMSEPVGDEDVQ
jgi:hypothetical protein